MKKIALINGPNLNLLGTREPDIYGSATLDSITDKLTKIAKSKGFEIQSYQSNQEGDLVDQIQKAAKDSAAIIINPAAYTHTSVAIRDALAAAGIPKVEIHLSNIHKREEFRKHSYMSEVVDGIVCGFGAKGYELALDAIVDLLEK